MEQVNIQAKVKGEAELLITVYPSGKKVDVKTVRGGNDVSDIVESHGGVDCVDASEDHGGLNNFQTSSTNNCDDNFGSISALGEFVYKMDNPKRGLFVVLNHETFDKHLKLEDRHGTKKDVESLRQMAGLLNFDFKAHDNLTRAEMMKEVHKYGKETDHSENDCFVCVILTHGTSDNRLYARDDSYELKQITDWFLADRCPSLRGKPKLFIMQACRGQKYDDGVPMGAAGIKGHVQSDTIDASLDSSEQSEVVTIPVAADFLFAHATPADYYAWRNMANGSIFIQILCQCFKQYGKIWDLQRILTLVAHRVSRFESDNQQEKYRKKKQIPSIVSQLRGKVVFTAKTVAE